ncbi:cng-3 [Pristionchus pacificus]|uniref:Cng-3 n=1 Tax=Pristionchus pacificus TaxID=54126 RepID=A0A2A6C2F2_PRIPA|nr:cng-3 [Pristionchus pacificus]|eukprot:PDM72277.1 cng-3 [Pristionchus pacificus]
MCLRSIRPHIFLRRVIPSEHEFSQEYLRNFYDLNYGKIDKEESFNGWLKTEWSRFNTSVNRRNGIFLFWSLFVSIACVYNLIFSTILIYESIWNDFYRHWILLNLSADSIYLLDMFIQMRTNYYRKGVKNVKPSKMASNYIQSFRFIFDFLSLIPFDLFLLKAPNLSLLRVNRFLKCYRIRETIDLIQTKASLHTLFSIFQIILVCVILFHWNACVYYAVSLWSYTVMEEVTDDDWPFTFERVSDVYYALCDDFRCQDELFPEENREMEEREEYINELVQFWENKTAELEWSIFAKEYSQTFYWSSLTMTTLGEQPSPNLSEHNILEIVDTIVGVLIFAVIMGSVADLIAQSNALRTSQQTLIDGLKQYMNYRNLTGEIHSRVIDYCQYTMDEEIVSSEEEIKQQIPRKLYLRVNKFNQGNMLQSHKFFEGLDCRLLQDIAARFRLYRFSPGDEIVSIGDFNRELFLLCSGELLEFEIDNRIPKVKNEEGEMMGASTLFWFEGDKFDHRSQRRIVSHGYSEVYVLERKDLFDVLCDFEGIRPEIVDRARKDQFERGIIAKSNAAEESEFRTLTQRLEAARKGMDTLTRRIEDARISFNSNSRMMKERISRIEHSFISLF